MNTDGHSGDRSLPRWATETPTGAQPTAAERAVLTEVLAAMRRTRHGSIQLLMQDAKVIQIDTTEKRRL